MLAQKTLFKMNKTMINHKSISLRETNIDD